MLKAKEILKLKNEAGLSLREIAMACNCGKSTVEEVLKRAKDAGLPWPTEMSNKELMSVLYPPAKGSEKKPEPSMETIFLEMKRKNVTLMLLWEEYKRDNPSGVMYTRFCKLYQNFKEDNKISMHKEHKAGEEVEVDWAGSQMAYADPFTGEVKPAYIFVAVLPASAYPFVHAYPDMKTASWIDAHVRAYEYFGGVPRVTIPDNCKTAVTKADRVDPVLNKTYNEMANHYGTILMPARPARPKDKGSDENMVGNISRRIIAVLRNQQFFSLYELNQAIAEELVVFVNRPFQKMEGNRLTAFEKIDKPCLQHLPSNRYEYAEWKEVKAQFNYHVEYEKYYYSIHYSYANKSCAVRATDKTIEIFCENERIAVHPRSYNPFNRYATLVEHMPEQHKIVSGWSPERFLSWAGKTGPNTQTLIKWVLESREHAVQTYRACMGIMNFGKTLTPSIMEEASLKAIENNTCSYKYFSIIVKQVVAANDCKKIDEKIIQHDNVRGMKAYLGGGIHA